MSMIFVVGYSNMIYITNNIFIYFSMILKTPCEKSNFTGELIELISSSTASDVSYAASNKI